MENFELESFQVVNFDAKSIKEIELARWNLPEASNKSQFKKLKIVYPIGFRILGRSNRTVSAVDLGFRWFRFGNQISEPLICGNLCKIRRRCWKNSRHFASQKIDSLKTSFRLFMAWIRKIGNTLQVNQRNHFRPWFGRKSSISLESLDKESVLKERGWRPEETKLEGIEGFHIEDIEDGTNSPVGQCFTLDE